MEDADKAAAIFLGILLAAPLMFLLLAAIAESTPGNSPLKKFLNSFFDTFQGKNRYSPKSTPNPVITKKEKVDYGAWNEKRGKRGGRYETRYSKRTGKPYRHYF